jgi:hypothetical protein
MSANVTVGYMTEQINRGRLDGLAARGWLAEEAAASRSRAVGLPRAPEGLGVAIVRLRKRIQGTLRPAGPVADPAALPARSTR